MHSLYLLWLYVKHELDLPLPDAEHYTAVPAKHYFSHFALVPIVQISEQMELHFNLP